MMKNLPLIISIVFTIIFLCLISLVYCNEQNNDKWEGSLGSGQSINSMSLKEILEEHASWLIIENNRVSKEQYRGDPSPQYPDPKYATPRKANFQHATLSFVNLAGSNLIKVNFENARLDGSDLKSADLIDANLKNAFLLNANLQNANLEGADLQKAALQDTNLRSAVMYRANFNNAFLYRNDMENCKLEGATFKGAEMFYVNLQNADLNDVDLTDAIMYGADFKDTLFEINPNSLPNIPSLATSKNLSHLKFKTSPHALVELRDALKKSGLIKQEREVTFAIKHSEFEYTMKSGDFWEKLGAITKLLLFEFTCKWGMSPLRPFIILLLFVFLFSVPYYIFLSITKKEDGIWRIWIPDRVRQDQGKNTPELLYLRGAKAIVISFYFSLLSAFNIGWRDLNVGNWISRLQPREYRLHASGWARFISGFQSLISLYLLALSFVSYFGRPFEYL